MNASIAVVTSASLNISSCIWHGYTQLSEGLKDRKFDWQSNITLNDGRSKRQILRQQSIVTASETWAVGVHLTTSMFSRAIADEWNVSIFLFAGQQLQKAEDFLVISGRWTAKALPQ